MYFRQWFLHTLVIIILASVAGCNPAEPEPTKQPTSGSETGNESGASASSVNRAITRAGLKPAATDMLMQYYSDDPDTLNVLTSNDTTSLAFQRQVYQGLADQAFDDPDSWEPVLAESWTFDEETLTYDFKLRKGVYWHPMTLPNGEKLPRTEFTAADVKFTFDCILNENIEAASMRSYYTNPNAKDSTEKYKIKLTVLDKYRFKLTWSEPYMLVNEFTLAVPIMPRHVYGVDEKGEPVSLDYRNSPEFAKLFNDHWANTRMCGTGPMIFDKWEQEQQVTLSRNPDYWGSPYYFNQVMYRNISNPNTALQQLLQNELDWAGIPQKDHYMQHKEHESVTSGRVKLMEYEYPGYRYMGYNQKRALFKDKNVRLAISHAVPVDDIIDKIYFKLATRLTGPFLPGSSACDDSLAPIPYDLDRAKQLLDEAGWKDSNDNGTRDKLVDGQRVEAVFDLMIFSDSPQFRQIAEIIRENCRRIGLEVKITPTKWALMLQKLRKKEFDATILGWALNWKSDPFQIWHGSQADLPESSNAIGYSNPELDKLIDTLRTTMDPSKQKALYHQIHKIIYDDQPYTFLFMEKRTAGRHARLDNINFYKIRPCVDSREWSAAEPRILSQ